MLLHIVLTLVGFAAGWFCARKFGSKGDAVVSTVTSAADAVSKDVSGK